MPESSKSATRESRASIQVIERMMSLLDALAKHAAPVNLKQLAADTSLHPSTAHRILGVMVENKLADRIEPGLYRLGIRLLELGTLVKSRLNVREQALPHMQSLHEELGQTVHLCVRHADEIVYIERAASAQSMMRVAQVVGARAPLHITAAGKVFLASDTQEECSAYIERTGLPRFTEKTLDAGGLSAELEQVRQRGYAFDNEEAERGVSCIGAGIYNDEARLVAGLSVSAPVERLRHDWIAPLQQTAERISRALGYRG